MEIKNIIFAIIIFALLYNIFYGNNVVEHKDKVNGNNLLFKEGKKYILKEWNKTVRFEPVEVKEMRSEDFYYKSNFYQMNDDDIPLNLYRIKGDKGYLFHTTTNDKLISAVFYESKGGSENVNYTNSVWRILPIYNNKYVIINERDWHVLLSNYFGNTDKVKFLDNGKIFTTVKMQNYKSGTYLWTITEK